MGDLKVNTKSSLACGEFVELFESSDNILIPNSNDFLQKNKNENIKMVMAYFQAFGRVMAFCLFNGLHLPYHVLPQLYRNYLFREMSPLDDRYEFAELMQHSMELIGSFKKDENIDKVVDYILSSGYYQDSEAIMAPQECARAIIHDIYITGRSIALKALIKGISLGGK